MREHIGNPCEHLLREWSYRREVVQLCHRAIGLLPPSISEGDPRQSEQLQELHARLAIALLALRHTSDQLQACEDEHPRPRPLS